MTGGQQAFGRMGCTVHDNSFDLLRGIFQALEAALGSRHLELHHVHSRTGDCFNEFADTAAKCEFHSSLHMRRQRIDMSRWSSIFPQLWLLFDTTHGGPTWTNGGFVVPAPQLPCPSNECFELSKVASKRRKLDYAFSIATANVQALYKGPHGHAGKLHYLQSQMRHYKLNCVAIQEARSDPGMSQHAFSGTIWT